MALPPAMRVAGPATDRSPSRSWVGSCLEAANIKARSQVSVPAWARAARVASMAASVDFGFTLWPTPARMAAPSVSPRWCTRPVLLAYWLRMQRTPVQSRG